MSTVYTHFQATVGVGYFPLYGPINEQQLLMLANNGTGPTTPQKIAELQPEVDRIRTALLAGNPVTTKTATLRPLTESEYNAISGKA